MLARFEGDEYRGVYDSLYPPNVKILFIQFMSNIPWSSQKQQKKKQKKIFRSKLKKSSSAANKEVASGINFIVPQKGHLKFSIIQGQNWYFSFWEASASDKLVSSVCLARTTVAQINVGRRTSRFH